jgi:hypothetical protein
VTHVTVLQVWRAADGVAQAGDVMRGAGGGGSVEYGGRVLCGAATRQRLQSARDEIKRCSSKCAVVREN